MDRGRRHVSASSTHHRGPVDFETTAIAVYSAAKVRMTITDNEISHNTVGIWLSKIVKAGGLDDNEFHHVTHKVVRG